MNWELIHRWNALLVGAFIVTHLGVHLMAVASPEAHSMGLGTMQQFYLDPRYQTVLLLAMLIQIVSGYAELKLFPKTGWRVVRNLSGAYLMLFMVLHVASVFYARYVEFVPTDFYWVAGSFAYEPIKYAAMAFYGLGVFSFFTHMIAVWVLAWKGMPMKFLASLWVFAVATTALILLAFAGLLYDIEIPDYVTTHYESTFTPLLDLLGIE